ncbi:hypothetical protein FTUN_8961 [Frigoriglobus tundricola]|uniref:Glycosyltransferase 2-like domain-containing protein n=1 Tax=Frigoriglobus tundricola TaxID=2774151 RepID=A0A6M5Z629_9BACT|nr:hypothetical protein [Frigoriglobus tundricola]QJX01317.1 hypothetical protein FTUN_8961 [Frigoriglobus tundricola]
MRSVAHCSVAVGPVMPGWGSWDWVGTFLVEHLGGPFRATTFAPGEVPDADVVLVVKHAPPPAWVDAVAARAAVIYCPIDYYGAAAEIDADADWLRRCARVLVHCRRLQPYFAPFAPAAYVDHPLKFAAPVRKTFRPTGPVLWVGVRSNLPALVAWVNAHPLPAPLDVLTNPEAPGHVPEPAALGFPPDREVRVHEWSPERHRAFVERARAALDVKGDDFRARHKPPAKALDFVGSGLPLAMNPGTSPVEHLAGLGLQVPSPLDVNRWLSERYWKETRHLGERLGRDLAPERVARRFRSAVEAALAARPEAVTVPAPARRPRAPAPDPRPVVPAAPGPELRLYGLLITKDDHPVFADWCRDQLRFYDAVVCLDGSAGDETARAAAAFGDTLIYLHERDFDIPHKTDHGLRAVVHDQIVARFGTGHWVMCCHADEFCYHDPRKVAAEAVRGGFDQVSWFSPHFYPHPDEWPDWPWLRHLPVPERFAHFHWSYKGDGFPWCEDRLYRAGPGVAWDRVTHGNVRPNGLTAPAPFHPTLRHFKVLVTDPAFYDVSASAAHYGTHWVGTGGRTGVPFPVREPKDLFVAAVKNYARCDRFDGTFPPAWDIGAAFRADPPDTFGGVARRYREARALAARGDHAGAAERLAARWTPTRGGGVRGARQERPGRSGGGRGRSRPGGGGPPRRPPARSGLCPGPDEPRRAGRRPRGADRSGSGARGRARVGRAGGGDQLPVQLADDRGRERPHGRADPVPGRGRVRRQAPLRAVRPVGHRGRHRAHPAPGRARSVHRGRVDRGPNRGAVPVRDRRVRPGLGGADGLVEHETGPGRRGRGPALRPAAPGAGVPVPAQQRAAAPGRRRAAAPVHPAPARDPRRVPGASGTWTTRPATCTGPNGRWRASARRSTATPWSARSRGRRRCWRSTRSPRLWSSRTRGTCGWSRPGWPRTGSRGRSRPSGAPPPPPGACGSCSPD